MNRRLPWLLCVGLWTACEKTPPPPETPVDMSDELKTVATPAEPTAGADYDPCAGKSCGDSCTICPPDSADCVETAVVKTCDKQGQCSMSAGPC